MNRHLHLHYHAAVSAMSGSNSYLVWTLQPQSRCTPGSETQVCCHSCRSHRCTDRLGSPPGYHSCPLHGLAAVNIHKWTTEKGGVISIQCWTRAWMNIPNVAQLTTGHWLDWYKTLQTVWTGTNSAHSKTLTLLIGDFIQLANVLFPVCQRGMSILLVSWHGPQQHRKGQSSEMFQTHKQHLFCC